MPQFTRQQFEQFIAALLENEEFFSGTEQESEQIALATAESLGLESAFADIWGQIWQWIKDNLLNPPPPPAPLVDLLDWFRGWWHDLFGAYPWPALNQDGA